MILSDNETRLDLLNNQAIAKTIVSIINDSKESITIGVHGDWGAGKSSILAMVEELMNTSESISNGLQSEYDDSSWFLTEDEEPDDAAENELDIPASACITVRFNGWQYQGFEDAKIALMSAIVNALQKEARCFYRKHPVKGAFKKLKDTCSRIWKNIDKLSLAKNFGKVGASLATGTAPLALLGIAAETAKECFLDEKKRNMFIDSAGTLLKNASSDISSFKEIYDFRFNYKELFRSAHIAKLVVLIDDLDRCLPKVAIETLEAIRMFLMMDDTAFIIAADDAMIRYSVKEYFPRILEREGSEAVSIDYNHFSDKYLEKLIQVPLHIPRIGIAEAQLYILLLMIESQTGESQELKELASLVNQRLSKPWALEQLSIDEIKSIMGDQFQSVSDQVKIAKSIDKYLAKNTGGNPRNIKRFVNMLLLRSVIAYNRGFSKEELKMPILAKMMLVEQYNNEFYKAIAAELREDGTCLAFDGQPCCADKADELVKTNNESSNKTAPETEGTEEQKQLYKTEKFASMLENEDLKVWMESEPLLSGIDLRPYFFACTEKEDYFFNSQEERLRELVFAVRSGKFTTGSKDKDIRKLDASDALYIFKIVSSDAFTQDLSVSKTPRIIEGIRLFVKNRTELQEELVDFLLTLPADKLGVWATGGWDGCIPRQSPVRPKLNSFFECIEKGTTNQIIKNAAASARR